MRKCTYFAVFLMIAIFCYSNATAQTTQISGTVKNRLGEPIANATVQQKNADNTVMADAEGHFSMTVTRPDALLTVSAVGYKNTEVQVKGTIVDVVMEPGSGETMSEVVVTAMGIRRERKALGYAVQEIQSAELLKNKDANLINSLNGKIAGVNITNSGGAPGSGASIIIRGGTSLERNNQPLFIIDGMPMDNSSGQGDNSAFDGIVNLSTTNSNRAMDVNPEDIESISVLKGPAAAALYGLRAAAGAVVITTKKGAQGVVSVNVNSRYTRNWVNKLPQQQSTYKQGSYYNGTFTDQTTRSWGDKFAAGETVYDNMGSFFVPASGYDNNVSVSGGTKSNSFYLSASNLSQAGVVPTTDFNRTTFRFNGEQKLGRFTFGVNSSYSMSKTQKTLTGSGLWGSNGTGYMESIIEWPRSDDMRAWLNADGTKRRLLPGLALDEDVDNPYWIIYKNPQNDKTNRLLGTVYTDVKIAEWLDATYRLGIDQYYTQYQNLIYPGSSVKVAWQNGMISQTDRNYNYLNSTFMLNAKKTFFQDLDVNLMLGTSAEDYWWKSNSLRAEKFTIPTFISINNAEQANKYFSQGIEKKRLVGVYGDLRLAYKNFLFLSATGRNDWTSTLAKEFRSFFYPSVSTSLVFSELINDNSVLSFGKIRFSWAEVGKDAPVYQTETYLFGPELTIGGGYRNSWTGGNPSLKPESTQSLEAGTELRFLNNRLGLDFTYYKNKSVDQILSPRVSNATGYILRMVNAGLIENNGIEVTLNATPVKQQNFTWNTTVNFSHNKGVVKELPGGLAVLYVTDVQIGNGKAASFDKGAYMGLSGSKWRTDSLGNLLLDWNTGYPLTSTLTTTPVGNREPKFIGGWNNSFTYKNWDLNFLFDFRKGGDVYNATEYLLVAYGLSKRTENRGETITFKGRSLNPTTGLYEDVTKDVIANEKYYRDTYLNNVPFFVENVNWLRLRSASLAYHLPENILAKLKYVRGATITASGTNLWLKTNYSGMDPEISAAGAGVVGSGSVGVDYAGVPATTGYAIGLNIKF